MLVYGRHAAELGGEVLAEVSGDVLRLRVRGEVFEVWLWCKLGTEEVDPLEELMFQFGSPVG